MTKIKVEDYSDIKVKVHDDGWSSLIHLTVQGEFVELDTTEARELVKALKKHIKKAEGK